MAPGGSHSCGPRSHVAPGHPALLGVLASQVGGAGLGHADKQLDGGPGHRPPPGARAQSLRMAELVIGLSVS